MRAFRSLRFPSVIKATNAHHASDILSRGQSFAVSVPSDSLLPQKGNRKISREERLAMVEEFVEKYKTANAGKFPTVSFTRKQVGGSFYTVKDLIQQLIHENKMSTVKKSNGSESIKPVTNTSYNHHEKILPSMVDSKDVSSFKPLQGSTAEQLSACEKNSFHVNQLFENHESVKAAATSGRFSDGDRDLARIQNNHSTTRLTSIAEETVRSAEASDTQDGSTSDSVCITSNHARSVSMENVCLKPSVESNVGIIAEQKQEELTKKLQEGPIDDVSKSEDDRNTSKCADTAESLPKNQTVWSNLKSFADGICRLWNKL